MNTHATVNVRNSLRHCVFNKKLARPACWFRTSPANSARITRQGKALSALMLADGEFRMILIQVVRRPRQHTVTEFHLTVPIYNLTNAWNICTRTKIHEPAFISLNTYSQYTGKYLYLYQHRQPMLFHIMWILRSEPSVTICVLRDIRIYRIVGVW